MEDTKGATIDSSSVSFTCRFPLGQSGLAPYAFGGGGRNFENVRHSFAQVGVGMEYRVTPHVGMFLDARGVVPDETKYYTVGRLGMRFSFQTLTTSLCADGPSRRRFYASDSLPDWPAGIAANNFQRCSFARK